MAYISQWTNYDGRRVVLVPTVTLVLVDVSNPSIYQAIPLSSKFDIQPLLPRDVRTLMGTSLTYYLNNVGAQKRGKPGAGSK